MSLDQIYHIVVLMLENRSFDHMLGYLSLPPAQGGKGRTDVDGLTGNETNDDENGTTFPVQRMASFKMNGDPCHEWACVEEQLSHNNGGFLTSYAKVAPSNPEFIMHYYTGADVPVYDHLASQFTICDRWFAPIPGATQPNRAYALAGTSDGHKNNFTTKELLQFKGFSSATIFEKLPSDVSWQCYSHDVSSIRFFTQFRVERIPQIDKVTKFFDDAAAGALADVSWIDPDFGQAIFKGPPNDDHAPHDIRHCQNLVSDVYNALLAGPKWPKTLLIVTYDEHGGFYDHVSPGQFPVADSNPDFAKYGVRVPAFIISPWVGRQAAFGRETHGSQPNEVLFDHTSIIRTILRRFATPAGGGSVPGMTARVDAANDLSVLLTEPQPRTDCTATSRIPNVPVDFQDHFRMAGGQSELKESLDVLVAQARADGVRLEKL